MWAACLCLLPLLTSPPPPPALVIYPHTEAPNRPGLCNYIYVAQPPLGPAAKGCVTKPPPRWSPILLCPCGPPQTYPGGGAQEMRLPPLPPLGFRLVHWEIGLKMASRPSSPLPFEAPRPTPPPLGLWGSPFGICLIISWLVGYCLGSRLLGPPPPICCLFIRGFIRGSGHGRPQSRPRVRK